MKNKKFILNIILIFLLSPIAVFAEPIEFILQPNNLTLDLSETGSVALRITHTNETNLTIPIKLSYISIFPLNFSEDDFNLAIYQNIYINISVPSNHLKAGDYNSVIIIQTPQKIYNISLPIKLKETPKFSIEREKNFTWEQGEKGVFYLNISNTGNTDLNLSVNIPNYSQIFNTVSSIYLPIGMKISLPIFYDIPLNFSSSNYDFIIKISNQSCVIHSLIRDTFYPKIKLNIPKEFFVKQEIFFNASCEDNEEVSKFFYKIKNKTYNISQSFIPNEIGDYIIEFICIDNFNNTINKTKLITIKPIPIKIYNKNFNILKKKKGDIITLRLFSTPQKVKYNATLEEFYYPGNVTMLLKSGSYSAYLSKNSTIRSTANGDVILELSNFNSYGNYRGKIKFNFDKFANESQIEITFNGSIGEYRIREPFNLSIRGFNLQCRGVDKNGESKVICDGFEFPGDIDPEDYVFFFTKSQIDLEEKFHKQELENIKNQKNTIIYVLIIICIILFIWGVIKPIISKMSKEAGI